MIPVIVPTSLPLGTCVGTELMHRIHHGPNGINRRIRRDPVTYIEDMARTPTNELQQRFGSVDGDLLRYTQQGWI